MFAHLDLDNLEVPSEEPLRQEFFISCLNDMIHTKAVEDGKKPTYHIQTFGCQMNARDSEKLSGILSDIGYEETESEEADIVLFNTCTVRENANDRLYGHLGQLKRIKEKNPEMIIGVCGCMMQEKEEVERIQQSYRYVDIVFGTHNIYKLAEILYRRLESKSQVVEVLERAEEIVENLPNKRAYSFKTGINIMFGCNNFCSFCIVPYVRGRERSREPEEIIAEIKKHVSEGVVEVMLLGQNVNSYGRGLKEKIGFAELLKRVAAIEGLSRIRFMTPHPKDLSKDVIAVMKEHENICHHIHLPLQSGSNRILKKMNRIYTREDYLSLVEIIRRELPEVSLTTDIIVGFPGEEEEDFLDTLDVVRSVGYDSAFTFIYSKRSGTPAAKMQEQVDGPSIKGRFNRLLAEIQEHSKEAAKRNVGKTLEVLIEGKNEQKEGMVTGRLDNNMIVHLPAGEELIGRLVKVTIDESKGFYYLGHLA